MKRILIFGHAGFSGSHMIRYLRQMTGISVYGTDYRKSSLVEEYQEDLTDFKRVDKIIKYIRPEYIINLAGLNQAVDPAQLYKANVFPVINTIRSLKANELFDTGLLIISSAAVYGDAGNMPIHEELPAKPVNIYGASKLAMEQLLPVLDPDGMCKIMIARTFNLIGEGISEQLSISSFIKQLIGIQKQLSAPVIKVGNLHPRRDYLDIRDAVKAYWNILLKGKPGEIYNVGSGRSISMKEILDMILAELGIEVTIETESSRVRKNEIQHSLADITKISSLGWSPEIDFRESLSEMLAYYQKGN